VSRSLPAAVPLPGYQRWRQATHEREPSAWSYLGQQETVETAALFGTLFWPEFVEVQECVLLAEHYRPEEFAQWWRQHAGKRSAIEGMVNHTHLYDLFPQAEGDDVLAAYEQLAGILRRCWKAALAVRFPARHFHFSYETEPVAYGPTLSFHQDN
jgi:hypothetical protein